MIESIAILVAIGIGVALLIVIALSLRRVVEPNETHIVQGRVKTTIYGQGGLETAGAETEIFDEGADEWRAQNAYWAWPSWIPFIGVQIIKMPLSIFAIKEREYDAYDVGKVPFVVDITAFFRINKPAIAAKRIVTMADAEVQLHEILRGAARKVLAFHDIEDIMLERSKFGQMFTEETNDQLKAWGMCNVKNIELMDIRDPRDQSSRTITDIMARKQSLINKDSRTEVAGNNRDAKIAEINAIRDAQVESEQADQRVGERTAEKIKKIGIADEQAQQAIKLEAKETATKEMAVLNVRTVRTAEINRDAEVVAADEERKTRIIKAEGNKQELVLISEGTLTDKTNEATGIQLTGDAVADAKTRLELATVNPQLILAEGIGENTQYQDYMVRIRKVEKEEVVGIEKAKALQAADIKVIANTGKADDGINKVMDLFSSKGGTSLGGMIEAFKQVPAGKEIIEKLVRGDFAE
jgi:flotillin